MSLKSVKLTVAALGVTLALGGASSAAAQQTESPAAAKPPVTTVKAGKKKLPKRGKIVARNGGLAKNTAKWLTPSQTYDVAAGYGKMATLALGACGSRAGAAAVGAAANLKYALRLTTFGRVTATWIGGLVFTFSRFTGNNFCDIAYRASGGAAWAAYHASQGRYVWVQIYQVQENRTFLPDVCHTYMAFNQTWRVWDLKTSGGC